MRTVLALCLVLLAGKPAHVSWSYGPWSGKALED